MKTIKITEEDYNTLMKLSKELQRQDNNIQAFPYFWEPCSEKLEVNIHGEGEKVQIYHDCEAYSPAEMAEYDNDLYLEFLKENDLIITDGEYDESQEREWVDFLESNDDYDVWTLDWKDSHDHNPSLFKSDVQNFIEGNKHHLGRNPRTYSRTIWRMPKMQSLVECVMRLFPLPPDEINHESRRFVYKKDFKETSK